MARDRERDAGMDQLLRAAMTAGEAGTAGVCPSADELAAYVEGTLPAGEREAMEPHLAGCALCQEALALMATMPEAPASVSHRPRGHTWWPANWRAWLVPAAGLASAVILYVALRPETALPPAPLSEPMAATVPAEAPMTGGAVHDEATGRAAAELAPRVPEADAPRAKAAPKDRAPAATGTQDVMAKTEEQPARMAAPVPPPPPAAEAMAAGQALEARPGAVGGVLAMKSTRAPEFLWRVEPGGRILGSVDEGRTWQLEYEATGELNARSAPSREVCWAVGPSGLVVRTTDGRTWQTVPFPEPLDLVAVSATSALRATVRTHDGRRFATDDGGATWKALQEIPAPPFIP